MTWIISEVWFHTHGNMVEYSVQSEYTVRVYSQSIQSEYIIRVYNDVLEKSKSVIYE